MGNYPSRYFTHFKQYLFSVNASLYESELPTLNPQAKPISKAAPQLGTLFTKKGYPLGALPKARQTDEQDGWVLSGDPRLPTYLVFKEEEILQVYADYFRPVKKDDEKYVVLSMEYFPGISLQQLVARAQSASLSREIRFYILWEVEKENGKSPAERTRTPGRTQ